jgi:DNA-binding MarR family transcriptional regulator
LLLYIERFRFAMLNPVIMAPAPSSKAVLLMPTPPTRRKKATATAKSRRIDKAPRSLARSAVELDTLQSFRTIFGSARTHDAEIRRIAGIPGAQLWALSEIARAEGMSVNTLSERMALHQTTASNLVNALVERKLIRRVRDDADQRVVRLHVAAEGKRMLLRAPGPYAGLLVDALHNLDDHQLTRLRQSLNVLVGVLHRTAENAAGEPLLGFSTSILPVDAEEA